MATISTPGVMQDFSSALSTVTPLIYHPHLTMLQQIVTVQDEIGDSLADRLVTSNALFSWGN